MKFRVMSSDGIKDFNTREDAEPLLTEKRKSLHKVRIVNEKPSVSIHECGHDEGKPCVNWERFDGSS